MKKSAIVLSLFIGLFIVGATVFAEEKALMNNQPVANSEAVTIQDLGVKGTGLLPGNPFYFMKEWVRLIKGIFILNPVKKAEYGLKIVNQKAAEIKKLEETSFRNTKAVQKAIDNYKDEVSRLRTRIESLQETSANPNVEKLADNLMDSSLKHAWFFEDLRVKFKENLELEKGFGEAKNEIIKTIPAISTKLINAEKFKTRMGSAVEKQESVLKELRAVEVLDQIKEAKSLSSAAEDKASELRENLLLKFSGRLAEGIAEIPKALEVASGDKLLRVKILDEAREKINDPEIKNQLNAIRRETLEKALEEKKIGEEEVKKALEAAAKMISELEQRISAAEGGVSNSVMQSLERAKFHYEQAKGFYEKENLGSAFGQTTAAQAAAGNSLDQIKIWPNKDYQSDLSAAKREYNYLIKKVQEEELTKEIEPNLFELFDQAEKEIIGLSQLMNKDADPEIVANSVRRIKVLLSTINQIISRIPKRIISGQHYQCYDFNIVKEETKLPSEVILSDQFGEERVKIIKPLELCTPTQKIHPPVKPGLCAGEGENIYDMPSKGPTFCCADLIFQPCEGLCTPSIPGKCIKQASTHLKCYEFEEISGIKNYPLVKVTDQFGVEILKIQKPSKLCVPAQKILADSRESFKTSPPADPHYKCYGIKEVARKELRAQNITGISLEESKLPVNVFLTDQFGKKSVKVLEPQFLCAPTIKTHITKIKSPVEPPIKPAPPSVKPPESPTTAPADKCETSLKELLEKRGQCQGDECGIIDKKIESLKKECSDIQRRNQTKIEKQSYFAALAVSQIIGNKADDVKSAVVAPAVAAPAVVAPAAPTTVAPPAAPTTVAPAVVAPAVTPSTVAAPPAAPIAVLQKTDHLKCYKIKSEGKIGDLPIVKVFDQFGIEILKPKDARYLCAPAQKEVISPAPPVPPTPPSPPPVPPVTPVKPQPVPVPVPVSRCEEIKKNIEDLNSLLKSGKISEQDYKLKYEAVKNELADCEQSQGVIPQPTPASAVPKPTPVPVPVTVSRCDEIKKNIEELNSLFKSGKISEQDYKLKYESLSKELAVCEIKPCADSDGGINFYVKGTATYASGINTDVCINQNLDGSWGDTGYEAPHLVEYSCNAKEIYKCPNGCKDGACVKETLFCTLEYNPVCGADNKTYSNECMAKAAGIGVQYRGECK